MAATKSAAATATHREKQDAVIVATTALLASKSFQEVLTAEEERGLVAALPSLRAFATEEGVIGEPLGQWSRPQILRFLALAVRAAVPLRTLPDHEAFREFSDQIPF